MWAASDHVGTHVHRRAQQRALVGTGGTGHRPSAQRDDLDVDDVGDSITHVEERFDRGEPVLDRHVGVGANCREAVRRHQASGALGPVGCVRNGEQMAARAHRLDRTDEIAGRIVDDLGEECLVEVGMGFGRRREEDPARQVDADDVVSGDGEVRADAGDLPAAVDQDVGRAPVRRHTGVEELGLHDVEGTQRAQR